jgi:hypothetical protein
LSAPRELPDFYKYTVDIIYAFIIGQSFLQLDNLVFPIQNITRYSSDIIGFALIYFIIVTGWIGYHRSISVHPHIGLLGNARYGFDLLILFIVYYLLVAANPYGKTPYNEIFVWILPFLFLLYVIWDGIKVFEYRQKGVRYTLDINRFVITFLVAIVTVALSSIYIETINSDTYSIVNNKTSFDIWFILLYFLIVSVYRFAKRIPAVQL